MRPEAPSYTDSTRPSAVGWTRIGLTAASGVVLVLLSLARGGVPVPLLVAVAVLFALLAVWTWSHHATRVLVDGRGVTVSLGLFLWTFSELGRLPVGWRALLPGAVVCAVGFEVLKLVGTLYVPRLVASSSALYGSLGIVIAILAWLAFFGRLLVYGAVVNVLRWEGGHGTVQVPLEAPRVDNAIAVSADRSGAVVDRLEE